MYILDDDYFLIAKIANSGDIKHFSGKIQAEKLPFPEICYHKTRPPYIKFNDLSHWVVDLNGTYDKVLIPTFTNLDTKITSNMETITYQVNLKLQDSSWVELSEMKETTSTKVFNIPSYISDIFPIYVEQLNEINIESCSGYVINYADNTTKPFTIESGVGQVEIDVIINNYAKNLEFIIEDVKIKNCCVVLKKFNDVYYLD